MYNLVHTCGVFWILHIQTRGGEILDLFLVTQWPIFKAFGTLQGPKMVQNGLKMGWFQKAHASATWLHITTAA